MTFLLSQNAALKIFNFSLLTIQLFPVSVSGAVSPINQGQSIYARSCIACHGSDGVGAMPGIPDFTGKGSPLAKEDDVLINSILEGVETGTSPFPMPAMYREKGFEEQDAKSVLDYIRREFVN